MIWDCLYASDTIGKTYLKLKAGHSIIFTRKTDGEPGVPYMVLKYWKSD